MQLQIPIEELKNYKSRDLIPLKCKQCNKIFKIPKNKILAIIKGNCKTTGDFCSKNCQNLNKTKTHTIKTFCSYCNKIIYKDLSQFKQNMNERILWILCFFSSILIFIQQSRHKE